jgi:hypothetical protein
MSHANVSTVCSTVPRGWSVCAHTNEQIEAEYDGTITSTGMK